MLVLFKQVKKCQYLGLIHGIQGPISWVNPGPTRTLGQKVCSQSKKSMVGGEGRRWRGRGGALESWAHSWWWSRSDIKR